MTIAAGTPPVIDITQLDRETGGLASTTCIEAIHAACLDTGFFVVVGHGLGSDIDEVFEAARSFFLLTEAQKEAVPRIDRYGFIPHTDHAMDTDRASGATEFLDMGLGDEVALPAIAGFEAAVRAYQRAALVTAHSILRALAIALRAEPGFFARHMANPQCRLRFLHYLETPLTADGSLPVPNTPHTDYGVITLLATDGVPGLEVKAMDATWAPVVAPAGSLVVNLGDMLARWTNDVYRSTPHRVVGSPDHERFSIPFFVNPDPATIVDCIPSCVTGDRPCRYEPVTAGDFLASRIDGTDEPYVDPGEGPSRV
jgi:isopenicillin N synthase-like dioxygenase